jgi:uracil-DNA glycosylase
MGSAAERREELKAVWQQARDCTKCPQLASTRQTVVFGSGNADADLMFVGEAPGANEDRQGLPFVGQAGLPGTATRCRRRSTPARTTCSASSS